MLLFVGSKRIKVSRGMAGRDPKTNSVKLIVHLNDTLIEEEIKIILIGFLTAPPKYESRCT